MASTVKSATMAVTIEESVVLNGSQQGSKKTFQIERVDEVYNRILTCLSGYVTTLIGLATTVDATANAIDWNDLKYFRVTNLDDLNTLLISIEGTGGATCVIPLLPSQSYIIGETESGIVCSTGGTTDFTAGLQNIDRIIAKPATSVNIDVEVFAASASA